jgi:hypothetical protein
MSAVILLIDTIASLKVSPVPSFGDEPTLIVCRAILFFYIIVWSTVIDVLSALNRVLSTDISNTSSVQQVGAEVKGIASVVLAVSPHQVEQYILPQFIVLAIYYQYFFLVFVIYVFCK